MSRLPRRPRRSRAPSRLRFLAFGLAVVLGAGALSARLFAIQVARHDASTRPSRRPTRDGPRAHAVDARHRSTTARARRSSRTSPPTACRSGPSDLPESRRDEVVADARRPRRHGSRRHQHRHRLEPAARATTRFGSPRTSIPRSPASSPRRARACPASRSSSRRGASTSTARSSSHVLGYTGPISGDELADLREDGYLNDDLIGKPASRRPTRTCCAARTARSASSATRPAAASRCVSTEQPPVAGSSLELTIDVEIQRDAEKALQWGMKAAGLKRGVVIVMNPQNGEILAHGLPARLRQQRVRAAASATADYQELLERSRTSRSSTSRSASSTRPGSTYKLVAGTGALADGKITASTLIRTAGVPQPRRRSSSATGTAAASACATSTAASATRATRSSTSRPAMLGIDRLGYWAQAVRLRRADRHRPAGRGARHRPDERVEADTLGQPIYPGRGLPGRHRPGLRRGHAAPAPQRLRALANGGTLLQAAHRRARSRARRHA